MIVLALLLRLELRLVAVLALVGVSGLALWVAGLSAVARRVSHAALDLAARLEPSLRKRGPWGPRR